MLLEQELFAQLAGLTGQVAIYLEDIQGNTVFSVNPERPFPAASLIKVLILAALLRAAAAGELSLEEKVTLKPENRVGGAGALSELSPDVSLPLRDLGTLMIVQSDNAATNEILDRIGFAKVNTLAAELGLRHTLLQRKMMDLSAAQAGRDNITSAGDMGLFLRLLYRGQVLSPVISATIINTMQRQQIRDKLPALIPEDIVIAHKTGDLPGVEHDAGIIYIPKRPCILVVLTDNLSDNRAGACLIAKIAKSVYSHFCLAE